MARKLLSIASAAALALLAHAANATTITFDEFPTTYAPVTGAYAFDGVTFSGGNAGLVPGIGGGDPGNWQIEGTNGSQFLGFNGPYSETATFLAPVFSAQLDFSRSAGSSDDTITLSAFDGATLVDTETVALGSINTWSTLSVSGSNITSLEWSATASTDFHPYGVDNFVFEAGDAPGGVPEPSTWALALVGFGGLGAVLRHRRRSPTFA